MSVQDGVNSSGTNSRLVEAEQRQEALSVFLRLDSEPTPQGEEWFSTPNKPVSEMIDRVVEAETNTGELNDNFDLVVSPVPMVASEGMTEQASVDALLLQ